MQNRPSTSLAALFAAMLGVALLTGCSTSFQPNLVQTGLSSIGSIGGTLHGGQAPISGGDVYLYAAGTSGYGKAATSLLSGTGHVDANGHSYVVSNGSGDFSISGDYTCVVNTQVYLVAVGGNPGLTTGTNNTAIVQMAGLGQCPSSGSLADQVPYVVVNEVSTVAFAYSMGGFATTAYNVSSPTSAQTGIANAMANTGNIVNIQYGQAPTKANGNPNGIVPQSKIYTLANILAACVNTSGPTSTQCKNLFTDATTSGGNVPQDESQAIFNIVHNPTLNVAALFGLQPANPAFAPNLGTHPTDWTLPIVYTNAISVYGTDGGTTIDSGPFNIAPDAEGNIWIGDEKKGVVEIGPQGAVSTYNKNASGTAFGQIKGVAVSPYPSPGGSIWASDAANNEINILNTSGTATFTSAAGADGIDGPAGIAFDDAGNAWVANDTGNSISKFSSTGGNGAPPKAHTFSGAGVSEPAWIAVDSNDNAFVTSQNSSYLGELADGNGNTKGTVYNITQSYALAIDSANNLWLPTSGGTTWQLDEVTCTTKTCSSSGSAPNKGGMNIPDRIALDGGGVLWIANQGAATVSAYNIKTSAWLTTAGFTTGTTSGAGVCLDAVPDSSGNLWTANGDGSVSQILGLATPTAMPLIPGNYEQEP